MERCAGHDQRGGSAGVSISGWRLAGAGFQRRQHGHYQRICRLRGVPDGWQNEGKVRSCNAVGRGSGRVAGG